MTDAQFEVTQDVQTQIDEFNRLLAECRAGNAHHAGTELTYVVEDLNHAYCMLPSELTFDAEVDDAIVLDNEEYHGFWRQVADHLVEQTRQSVGRAEFNAIGSPYRQLLQITRIGLYGFNLDDLVDSAEQRVWANQAMMSNDVMDDYYKDWGFGF